MTKLRGIQFGPCWDAAGVRGWNGEGYWFHHLPFVKQWLKLDLSTRVAKTATLLKNPGNMPLGDKYTMYAPKEFFPRCIWVDWVSARTFNAVALSGPGAEALFDSGLLASDRPFMISFMSIRKDEKERMLEFGSFAHKLKERLLALGAKRNVMALQINITCPNTGLDTSHLIDEAARMLDIAGEIGIPIILKINLFAPIKAIKEIDSHPACDAICTTNAIPFGSLPEKIGWKKLFPAGSPLANRNKDFGGGGYSGPELLSMVCEQVHRAKDAGVTKPFNLGGGIRSARDVEYAVQHAGLVRGHDSIFFASAAMVRPWNVPGIVRKAHELLG